MTCNLNYTMPCYSDDCRTVVWCSMIKDSCSRGLTPSVCFGRDAGPDGAADSGPADTMTADAADTGSSDRGFMCVVGEVSCYSSDCATVASCNDTGTCPAGQLYWADCFGPDAGRDR